ncbi:MAG: hypothetical protein Roseis2KO_05730 [Roseivirga sp.]
MRKILRTQSEKAKTLDQKEVQAKETGLNGDMTMEVIRVNGLMKEPFEKAL